MSLKGKKENKTKVDSSSTQKNVSGDAYNETKTSQDTYNININIFATPENLDKISQIIPRIQPKLHSVVANKDKLNEQTKKWKETDGIFTLIDDYEDTIHILESLSFDERRQKLTKLLEPIINTVENSDMSHIVNSIEIVCKEDQIDETTDEEDLSELQQDLGVRRNTLFQATPTKHRGQFKKIYNLIRCEEMQTVLFGKIKRNKGK